MKVAIFTDLDGTLIDHFTYSWEEAAPILSLLKALSIPVIPVTSKTYAETRHLLRDIGLTSPFAVENGAAVFFPEDFQPLPEGCRRVGEGFCVLILGRPYEEVRAFFERYAGEYGLVGMGDMDVEDLERLTGLKGEALEMMRRRDYTEPFIAKDEGKLKEFVEVAERNGYRVLRGGRFYHLVDARQGKGVVVKVVKETFGEPVLTVGLGDSENDEDMLREVDIPVLIPNPKRGYAPVSVPNLIRAKCMGPKGWAEEVMKILQKLKVV